MDGWVGGGVEGRERVFKGLIRGFRGRPGFSEKTGAGLGARQGYGERKQARPRSSCKLMRAAQRQPCTNFLTKTTSSRTHTPPHTPSRPTPNPHIPHKPTPHPTTPTHPQPIPNPHDPTHTHTNTHTHTHQPPQTLQPHAQPHPPPPRSTPPSTCSPPSPAS